MKIEKEKDNLKENNKKYERDRQKVKEKQNFNK